MSNARRPQYCDVVDLTAQYLRWSLGIIDDCKYNEYRSAIEPTLSVNYQQQFVGIIGNINLMDPDKDPIMYSQDRQLKFIESVAGVIIQVLSFSSQKRAYINKKLKEVKQELVTGSYTPDPELTLVDLELNNTMETKQTSIDIDLIVRQIATLNTNMIEVISMLKAHLERCTSLLEFIESNTDKPSDSGDKSPTKNLEFNTSIYPGGGSPNIPVGLTRTPEIVSIVARIIELREEGHFKDLEILNERFYENDVEALVTLKNNRLNIEFNKPYKGE